MVKRAALVEGLEAEVFGKRSSGLDRAVDIGRQEAQEALDEWRKLERNQAQKEREDRRAEERELGREFGLRPSERKRTRVPSGPANLAAFEEVKRPVARSVEALTEKLTRESYIRQKVLGLRNQGVPLGMPLRAFSGTKELVFAKLVTERIILA